VEVSVPDYTPEQLDLLLELQATDQRVRRIEHTLDDLPEQRELAISDQRAQELTRAVDELGVALDQAGAEQRQLEREVDVLSQRRDAERARIYDGSVVNARELKAIEAEIETTVRRLSEHEDLLLEALERTETLEARRDVLASELAAEQERRDRLEVARNDAAAGLLAELGELKVARDREAAELPAELRARYEQQLARTGGVAVGKLEANACTACRIELSMADVGDLYAGPPLTTCPQCRRLLVVPA
jgi:uncharacterized protein